MNILFVSYGGGHIEMCLPVMRALRKIKPDFTLDIIALTTAYKVAQIAGESALGYLNFVDQVNFEQAKRYGELIIDGVQHPTVCSNESIAYLGINFLEWVNDEGFDNAFERWKKVGRGGFFPLSFFKKILIEMRPDVVVTTNSPRSEHAAIEAAVTLGIPTVTMVDLFALKNDPFIRRSIYADRITVLTQSTKSNLVHSGVDSDRIVVTGNPAFDALTSFEAFEEAERWKQRKGWVGKHIVMWAGHKELEDLNGIDFTDTSFGQEVQNQLVNWVKSRSDICLIIRYHPNEWQDFQPPSPDGRVHWSDPSNEQLLPVLLNAQQVVVQSSTVGVQAYTIGKRVIGLGFSPAVQKSGMNAAKLDIGCSIDSIDELIPELERGVLMEFNLPQCKARRELGNASELVAYEILSLLKR